MSAEQTELELLRERLERLEGDQAADHARKVAEAEVIGQIRAPVPPEWVREGIRKQDEERAARLRQAAEAAAEHERRLERNRPQLERLEARLAELRAAEAAERQRSAQELERVGTELRKAQDEWSRLATPPAHPAAPSPAPQGFYEHMAANVVTAKSRIAREKQA